MISTPPTRGLRCTGFSQDLAGCTASETPFSSRSVLGRGRFFLLLLSVFDRRSSPSRTPDGPGGRVIFGSTTFLREWYHPMASLRWFEGIIWGGGGYVRPRQALAPREGRVRCPSFHGRLVARSAGRPRATSRTVGVSCGPHDAWFVAPYRYSCSGVARP